MANTHLGDAFPTISGQDSHTYGILPTVLTLSFTHQVEGTAIVPLKHATAPSGGGYIVQHHMAQQGWNGGLTMVDTLTSLVRA